MPQPPDIRPPLDLAEIRQDASRLLDSGGHEILAHGGHHVLAFVRHEAPALFHELARQREITFRASGQGSGTAFDETPEDEYYTQLVLWDDETSRIIGAYRIGFTAEVLATCGAEGLYLSHMFDFTPDFFTNLGSAMELSRSFVIPACQGDRLALAMLWNGLGLLLVRHGGIRGLFGSVTISADYSPASRELLVAWLRHHRSLPGSPPVRARAPFGNPNIPAPEHENIDALRPGIVGNDQQPMPIPPLIRHYLPLGARFHAFHREALFGDAVYCLLSVDIEQMPPAHRRRFLGLT